MRLAAARTSSAPVIILCHGYDSNRSDLLWLGSILAYNTTMCTHHFSRTQARKPLDWDPGRHRLIAAIELYQATDVNPNRVGLFGTSVGGYAALVAGEINPKVRQSRRYDYSTPERMLIRRLKHVGGSSEIFHVHGGEFHLLGWAANLTRAGKST